MSSGADFNATSQSAPATNSSYRPRSKKLARLAPLDHIKALYHGANSSIPAGAKPRRIFQKKDLIEAVRHVSPVRQALKEQSAGTAGRGITTDGPMQDGIDSTTRAIIDLEDGVNEQARRYNDIKQVADRKQQELDKLLDELRSLELENEALKQIEASQTPDAARLQELEAEIVAVQERMEQKLTQKLQYEHMTRRLKANQVSFDAHIKGMENALRASSKELGEVTELMRQLELGKQEAVSGLEKYQQQLAAARRLREKELADRRQEASNARRMEEWRQQREASRQELAAEMRGDLTKEQEQELMKQLQDREGQSEQLKAASKERAARALTLEEAFKAIRQATGVTTLDEMVEKFMGQGANRAALQEEKLEAERRLNKVKQMKEEAEAEFAEMKASGVGGTELSREVYEKLDKDISGAKAALKVSKASCERLESALVAVRQGALGLMQRLAPFGFLDDPDAAPIPDHHVVDLDDPEADPERNALAQESNEVLRMLQTCERRLAKMMEAMSSAAVPIPAPTQSPSPIREERRPASRDEHSRPWTAHDDPALHKIHVNNVRILPKRRPGTENSTGRTPRSTADMEEEEDDDTLDSDNNRLELKRRSKKRFQDEVRRKEQAERREVLASTNYKSKRAIQKEAIGRLAGGKEFTPSLTFLTQRPDLD